MDYEAPLLERASASFAIEEVILVREIDRSVTNLQQASH